MAFATQTKVEDLFIKSMAFYENACRFTRFSFGTLLLLQWWFELEYIILKWVFMNKFHWVHDLCNAIILYGHSEKW